MKSKVIFAAKEPYLRNYDDSIVRKVWEELGAEYKKIIELGEYISERHRNYVAVKC